jgi:hypothetical protein
MPTHLQPLLQLQLPNLLHQVTQICHLTAISSPVVFLEAMVSIFAFLIFFFPNLMISLFSGTFYTPGLGACGGTNNENQDVVAIPFGLWDQVPGWDGANPNNNPICGKSIDITYQGKTVTAVVVDECMGCTNNGSCGQSCQLCIFCLSVLTLLNSVDMSPHAFNQLADPSLGRIHGISWKWHT